MPSPTLDKVLALKVASIVSTGASMEDVAGALGHDRSTIYRWRQRGREAWEARGETDYPTLAEMDDPYEVFYVETAKARFEAKVEALGAVRRAFRGYDETRTKTKKKRNEDGDLEVIEEETTTVTKFDWQAAMTWLERAFPKEFTRLLRAELGGPDGGAIPIEQRATDLAAELRAYRQGIEDAKNEKAEAEEPAPVVP